MRIDSFSVVGSTRPWLPPKKCPTSQRKTPRASTFSARSGTIRALTWRTQGKKQTVEVYYLYIRCIYIYIYIYIIIHKTKSIHLSIHLSIYPSKCLFIYLSIYPTINLFDVYRFTYLFISLFSSAIYLAFYLSNPLLSLCSMPIECPMSLI